MIKPTDEMVQAFMRAAHSDPVYIAGQEVPNARAGLAAVLAIVERDYAVRPRRPMFSIAYPHAFVRSDDPNFGSAFGGACAAVMDGTTCGFPEPFHRSGS